MHVKLANRRDCESLSANFTLMSRLFRIAIFYFSFNLHYLGWWELTYRDTTNFSIRLVYLYTVLPKHSLDNCTKARCWSNLRIHEYSFNQMGTTFIYYLPPATSLYLLCIIKHCKQTDRHSFLFPLWNIVSSILPLVFKSRSCGLFTMKNHNNISPSKSQRLKLRHWDGSLLPNSLLVLGDSYQGNYHKSRHTQTLAALRTAAI